MRVIIAGSRTFNNYGYFKEKMLEVQKQINIDEIISGVAKGPDLMGVYWGERHNTPVKKFYADWGKIWKCCRIYKKCRNGASRRFFNCLLGWEKQRHQTYDRYYEKTRQAWNCFYVVIRS